MFLSRRTKAIEIFISYVLQYFDVEGEFVAEEKTAVHQVLNLVFELNGSQEMSKICVEMRVVWNFTFDLLTT